MSGAAQLPGGDYTIPGFPLDLAMTTYVLLQVGEEIWGLPRGTSAAWLANPRHRTGSLADWPADQLPEPPIEGASGDDFGKSLLVKLDTFRH